MGSIWLLLSPATIGDAIISIMTRWDMATHMLNTPVNESIIASGKKAWCRTNASRINADLL